MQDNRCQACGQLQQYSGEGNWFCERCGAKNFSDGSCEYNGSQEGIEESKDRMARYDNSQRWRMI